MKRSELPLVSLGYLGDFFVILLLNLLYPFCYSKLDLLDFLVKLFSNFLDFFANCLYLFSSCQAQQLHSLSQILDVFLQFGSQV